MASSDPTLQDRNKYKDKDRGDLLQQLSKTEIRKLFNVHIEDEPLGPYAHFSEAVYELLQLEKKGRVKEAEQLKALLTSFAKTLNCTLGDLMEWPALMDQRDALSHPFNRNELEDALSMHSKELLQLSKTEIRNLFNVHIQNEPMFGPYQHFSKAVYEVLQLEKRGRVKEAEQLKALLTSFANTLNCTLGDLMEWPNLMHQRDALSHPFNRKQLEDDLSMDSKELHGLKGAAKLILAFTH